MGYYTNYTLSIIKDNINVYDFEDIIEKRIKKISNGYDIHLNETMNAKWYDFDVNMIQLSKEFPNVLFKLEGEGEESGDIWRAFYMNGVCEHQQIEMKYPDFDENSFWTDNFDDKKSYDAELKIRQEKEEKERNTIKALEEDLLTHSAEIDRLSKSKEAITETLKKLKDKI